MRSGIRKMMAAFLALVFMLELAGCTSKETETDPYEERLVDLMSDEVEIERKWLIDPSSIPYDLDAEDVVEIDILQTYICFDPEIRVRCYDNGDSYEMTIKNNMSYDGLTRDEVNMEINRDQYDNMMVNQQGMTIHKTRYQFYSDDLLIAIDIFHDELDGLAYMEIEFLSEEESRSYVTPDWVIAEVTDDVRYKNGHLARYGIPQDL